MMNANPQQWIRFAVLHCRFVHILRSWDHVQLLVIWMLVDIAHLDGDAPSTTDIYHDDCDHVKHISIDDNRRHTCPDVRNPQRDSGGLRFFSSACAY